ncbi:hypothetical protein Tco_0290345 [Tanacetum coccineum]
MSSSSSSTPQPHHIQPTTIVTTTSSTPPPPLQQRPTRVRWFSSSTTKMVRLVLIKTTDRESDGGDRKIRHESLFGLPPEKPARKFSGGVGDVPAGGGEEGEGCYKIVWFFGCMSTRSSTTKLVPPFFNPESVIRNCRRNRGEPSRLFDFEEINMDLNLNHGPPPAGLIHQNPSPGLRMMEELRQPTMLGRGGPIAPMTMQATNFGLKNHMIQQVQQSCQYHGLPGGDANKHIDKFLTVTQT